MKEIVSLLDPYEKVVGKGTRRMGVGEVLINCPEEITQDGFGRVIDLALKFTEIVGRRCSQGGGSVPFGAVEHFQHDIPHAIEHIAGSMLEATGNRVQVAGTATAEDHTAPSRLGIVVEGETKPGVAIEAMRLSVEIANLLLQEET